MLNINANILKMKEYINNQASKDAFYKIYPFATENIHGYFKNLQLKNCSLLTVGSSADQAINANCMGCHDITIFDINPYTRYYFYLKKSAMLTLSNAQFLHFFLDDPLNAKQFQQILPVLDAQDSGSAIFWKTLLDEYPSSVIKKNLFSNDVLDKNTIKRSNYYLICEKTYQLARQTIQDFQLDFVVSDIFKVSDSLESQSFDRIILSNVSQYLEYFVPKGKSYYQVFYDSFSDLEQHLNKHGIMQLIYLYSFGKEDIYREDASIAVYNLKKIWEAFPKNTLSIEWIESVDTTNSKKDAVVTYTKK